MKAKKVLHAKQKKNLKGKDNRASIKGFVAISLCAVFAIVLAVGSNILDNTEKDKVYASSKSGDSIASVSGEEVQRELPYGIAGVVSGVEETPVVGERVNRIGTSCEQVVIGQRVTTVESSQRELPYGIAGVVSGVEETPVVGERVNRIGTSCEQVVIGQRVTTVESSVPELNFSESMVTAVNDFDSKVMAMAENPTIMSDTDYDTLLRIVEAEAGGEDLKGRILVGNVIMNRVKHEEFPDTVTEVVWEYKNGVPQFSPTYDGRINEVVPSDTTKEAVKQVMEGVDYSEGALFFLQKSESEAHSVSWFEKDLKRLFKHGVHEFYTYPEEGEATEAEEDLVQMESNQM